MGAASECSTSYLPCVLTQRTPRVVGPAAVGVSASGWLCLRRWLTHPALCAGGKEAGGKEGCHSSAEVRPLAECAAFDLQLQVD